MRRLALPAGVLVVLGGAAVTVALAQAPTGGRVLHEDLPGPGDGVRTPQVGESGEGLNPAGFAAGDKVLAEPKMDSQGAKEPVYGRAGAATDRRTEDRPDLNTSADPTLHYVSVFDPDVVPFKRNGTYDTVTPDYTMVLRSRATTDVPVGGQTRLDRDRFWGDLWVELSPGSDVALPSVAPDMRILSYRTDPAGVRLTFSRDGGDNFYVRSDDPAVAGKYHLVFFADADGRYFAPALPTGPRLTPRRVSALAPPEVRPALPDGVRQAAQRTLDQLALDPDQELGVVFNRLVHYFRGFEAKPAPTPSGDIYRDLCDSQAGVCRHRSFAFMVTANAVGIPTRFVYNEAHAFVEVWFPERGWQRIDLGGAALRMEIENADGKSRHVPRADDPFAKPEPYLQGGTNYSALQGDVRGLSDQQLAEWRKKPGETPASGDFDPADAPPVDDSAGPIGPDPGLPIHISRYGDSHVLHRNTVSQKHSEPFDFEGPGASGLDLDAATLEQLSRANQVPWRTRTTPATRQQKRCRDAAKFSQTAKL